MNGVSFTTYFGDEVVFEQESLNELSLSVNNVDLGVINRDDVVELIGFLSEFVDGEI